MEVPAAARDELIYVDDMARVLRAFTYGRSSIFGSKPVVTVFGFGELRLTDLNRSFLVDEYYKLNPNGPTPDLHTLAKKHATQLQIIMATVGNAQPVMMGSCEVLWRKIGSYKNNLQNRHAEIDQYD